MTVQSFLTSYLAMRTAVLGPRFAEVHGGTWLVWEPGTWKPDPGPAMRTLSVGTAYEPGPGDALCFQLGALAPEGRAVRVGRDRSCEVVIDDGTVSRHHLTFHATAGGWELEVLRAVKLDGEELEPGARRTLHGGSLQVGGVWLTVHENAALQARLAAR